MLTGKTRNLMAKDDFKNLGFRESDEDKKKTEAEEKGAKGELRW